MTRRLSSPVPVLYGAMVLALIAGTAPLGARDGVPGAAGTLTVISDPAGASVYVDGELAGQSPVTVQSVPAGDHRVRIVKPGYLENGRVVTIGAGRTAQVSATLTASSASAAPSATAAAAPGGGSKKWLWIGLAAGGGTAAALTLANRNHAPTIDPISVSRSTALQGQSVTFTATGRDEDSGDSLTYAWDFGDGATATGASTSHAFSSAGTFTVKATVSDSKKSASTTADVTVRSLTAIWRGPLIGSSTTFNTVVTLTQSGTNLSGTYSDQFANNGTVSGSVNASGDVAFTVTIPFIIPFRFNGTVNADVSSLVGVANDSGFVNRSWTLTR